ncbi:MAG TPA: cell division protein FtsH, partial [Chloroflexota bacterium]
DLRNLVNESALLAARRDEDAVHQRDFLDALEKLTLGPARHLLMAPEERRRVAYHEGGHTILGLLVPGSDPVNRVTILPRGQALGVTYQRPQDERHNYDQAYLQARLVGVMGGRAAEELVYGDRTSGAESDLEQATNLAHHMVTRWGMSEKLGPVSLAPRDNALGAMDPFGLGGGKQHSEETAQVIDEEVQRILQESYAEASRLLSTHRAELDALAEALLEKETLEEQQILDITGLPSAASLSRLPVYRGLDDLVPAPR